MRYGNSHESGDDVSILVLVDVALEPEPRQGYRCDSQFQSLFSWMLLLNPGICSCELVVLGVSILVLVDVALEPSRG